MVKVGRYIFSCRMNDDAVLPPFKGSALRGVLSHAVKRITCTLKLQECAGCLLAGTCVYCFLFEPETAMSAAGEGAVSTRPPKPYVLDYENSEKRLFRKGEQFGIPILLLGRANEYLPHLIFAFKELGHLGLGRNLDGKRADFSLEQVFSNDKLVYDSTHDRLDPPGPIELSLPRLSGGPEENSKISLLFETPLRVKDRNSFARDLPFSLLIRTVLRRISSIELFHGDGDPGLPYKELIEVANHVATLEDHLAWKENPRFSFRQNRKMFLGGLAGSITYEGNLRRFLPLLQYGEQVHIGKQTTFGLGKYRILEHK